MGLDFVEMVIAVEQMFDISIPDAVAEEMTTPAIMITYLQNVVGSAGDRKACISQRAFHRVRSALMTTLGVGRSEIALVTRIDTLFSGTQRHELWKTFREHTSLSSLRDRRFGSGWLFGPRSVKDLVSIAISHQAKELNEEKSWTHEEVRQVVRSIISEQLGIQKFRDTDEFVRDLGVD